MIESVIFYILAALLIVLALVVVTRTNPVASALALVVSFGILASLYALLQASLVAILQVLVYAGGIMVLVLFVIMLLNLHPEDLKPLRASWPFTLFTLAAVLGGVLIPVILLLLNPMGPFAGMPAVLDPGFGGIAETAKVMFSDTLLAFEILSLLLTSAIVGAVVLSKRRL